jgi:hypothetical protein
VRTIGRRKLLALLMAASATPVWAQSATAEALDDFSRYLNAAAAIFGELALGLRNADAQTIRGPSARLALGAVEGALGNQAVSNTAVVDALRQYRDLGQYRDLVGRMAAEPTDASPEQVAARNERLALSWSSALAQVSESAEVAREVAAIVDASVPLRSVLTDEQQVALRDTLAMREVILARLAALPPPTSADELRRLDNFIGRYGDLIAELRQIRVALNRALRE